MLEGSEIVVTQRELLIAVILAALFYLVAALLGAWRGTRQSPAGDLDLAPGAPPAAASATEMAEVQERLAKLGQRVETLERMLGAGAGDKPEIDDPVYGPAALLVQQGMPAEEVANRLGLSRAEIDLIDVLHGKHAGRARDPAKSH